MTRFTVIGLVLLLSVFANSQQNIFHNDCVDVGIGNVRTGERYCRVCSTTAET